MSKFTRKRAAVLGIIGALAITAVAVAYWTESGSGSGTGASGNTLGANVTVNQDSVVSNLYPGGTAQALSGDFDNANDSAVKVGTVTVSSVETDQVGCDSADFAIGGTAPVNAEIASGNDQGSWAGLTIRMLNRSDDNQDACKGATVTVHYAVSAAS